MHTGIWYVPGLPSTSIFFCLLKLAYSGNLIFSYPIMISPCNLIIESYVFKCCFRENSVLRHWLKNFSRFIVCITACFIAVALADKIDKFLGLLGAVLCAPLALTMPALIHMKLIAKTNRQRLGDLVIVIVSILILFFCTAQSILNWNSEDSIH